MMKNSNVTSMSNANVGKAFNTVIKGMSRDNMGEILFNWNESELNPDGDRIICYPGRDGRYSRGKEDILKSTRVDFGRKTNQPLSLALFLIAIGHLY